MVDETAPRFTIDLVATASTALRLTLGLPPRSMTTVQFVRLIGEEIGQLRAEGWGDAEIAGLIHEATGEPLGAADLSAYQAHADTSVSGQDDELAARAVLSADEAAHNPDEENYRGHRLTVVRQGTYWQVSVCSNLPDQTELNLPINQDPDRGIAIQSARDLVDELLDGRALGELGP